MNWIKNLKRPTVKKVGISKDIPDNFWDRCPKCSNMLFHAEITQSHYVCPHCGYHFTLPVLERLNLIFDAGKYTLIQLPKTADDPLNFRDIKKYIDRLKESRKKTGQKDAVQVAYGKIDGHRAVVVIFNFAFMGGSMGTAVGEALIVASELAKIQQAGLIVFPASGGARMQEGILSLMQMTRTILAVKELANKKLPYIVVLTNPTTGGVTASFAMQADITLAEPDAIIGFAGARVIEQTIHEVLPPNFQKSEYLFDHGMIDQVVERKDLKTKISEILTLFGL